MHGHSRLAHLGILAALGTMLAVSSGCQVVNAVTLQGPRNYKGPSFALTDDGWELAIYHFPPKRVDTRKDPVILCHGMALNGSCWFVTEETDFPSYLASKGYDVYVCDLRGHGQSRLKDNFLGFRGVDLFGKLGVKDDPYYWTVDDYAAHDIPAVIEYVRTTSGSDHVTWIGHSMGGMIMYAFLQTSPDPSSVARFVALGSPIIIPQPPNALLADMEGSQGLLNALMVINTRDPIRNTAIFDLQTPFDTLYYVRDNMARGSLPRIKANCFEDIPRGVSDQMMEMVRGQDFVSADATFDYVENLSRITIPMLFVCAKVDFMAPPYSVYVAYHGVASEDKSFRELSTANHYSVNYGHCDMLIGKNARTEVYPEIVKWLNAHPSQSTAPDDGSS
jgi:pimeloyl-ACP methyl ester carboxylesterase